MGAPVREPLYLKCRHIVYKKTCGRAEKFLVAWNTATAADIAAVTVKHREEKMASGSGASKAAG
jgi:hypothetical protein